MTVELLHTLATVSFLLAGILLFVTVLLFFVLKIPEVYGDLSGRTAKKAIENIRQRNEQQEKNGQNEIGEKRVGKTDKISPSGRLLSHTGKLAVGPKTEKIPTNCLTEDKKNSQETVLLQPEGSSPGETTLLQSEESDVGETTLLQSQDNDFGETTVLSETQSIYGIEYEITFMESKEIII